MSYSTESWTPTQLNSHLNHLEQCLQNDCFKRDALFTDLTQSLFSRLIIDVDDLLQQAQRAGKRIDFLDEVGTNGRIEDITSLIHSIRQAVSTVDKPTQTSTPNQEVDGPVINHFYGAGVGYFANGLFFTCSHEDELAFFVDRNRIYFHRHLVRAFGEAKTYLQTAIR